MYACSRGQEHNEPRLLLAEGKKTCTCTPVPAPVSSAGATKTAQFIESKTMKNVFVFVDGGHRRQQRATDPNLEFEGFLQLLLTHTPYIRFTYHTYRSISSVCEGKKKSTGRSSSQLLLLWGKIWFPIICACAPEYPRHGISCSVNTKARKTVTGSYHISQLPLVHSNVSTSSKRQNNQRTSMSKASTWNAIPTLLRRISYAPPVPLTLLTR